MKPQLSAQQIAAQIDQRFFLDNPNFVVYQRPWIFNEEGTMKEFTPEVLLRSQNQTMFVFKEHTGQIKKIRLNSDSADGISLIAAALGLDLYQDSDAKELEKAGWLGLADKKRREERAANRRTTASG
jgi:hypothetical protein